MHLSVAMVRLDAAYPVLKAESMTGLYMFKKSGKYSS